MIITLDWICMLALLVLLVAPVVWTLFPGRERGNGGCATAFPGNSMRGYMSPWE